MLLLETIAVVGGIYVAIRLIGRFILKRVGDPDSIYDVDRRASQGHYRPPPDIRSETLRKP